MADPEYPLTLVLQRLANELVLANRMLAEIEVACLTPLAPGTEARVDLMAERQKTDLLMQMLQDVRTITEKISFKVDQVLSPEDLSECLQGTQLLALRSRVSGTETPDEGKTPEIVLF